MYKLFNINEDIINFVNENEKKLSNDFHEIDTIYEYNQLKILKAFIDLKVSDVHFNNSLGYGYTDLGREKIEEVYKMVFNTEDALVRQQIVSGTHAISIVYFALTHFNDEICSITGIPYDTLKPVIGFNNDICSLKEYGVKFSYIDMFSDDFNYDLIKNKLETNKNIKIISIQKSRGYEFRNAISNIKIKKVIDFIKKINNNIIIFVDNCYSEFVDKIEPTDCGADIMCGSLIKNAGGTFATTGAYIVGKKKLIEKCAYRLTAPGIGKEIGVSFNQNRNILQGLFFSPQIVANSLKIIKLFSFVLNNLNIETMPHYNEEFNDIVLSIKFNDKLKLINFCEIVQSLSPIDSFVRPVPNPMPGYSNDIIMAAGTFVSGASIELTCDAPIIEPYIAYLQGGITYYQGKIILMKTLQELNLKY